MSSRSFGMPSRVELPLTTCPTAWNSKWDSGAIPLNAPPDNVPSPLTEPATWVPCPWPSAAPSSQFPVIPYAAQVEVGIGKDWIPVMWSLKSACIALVLEPVSSPVSATVTIIPDPSSPDHDEFLDAI